MLGRKYQDGKQPQNKLEKLLNKKVFRINGRRTNEGSCVTKKKSNLKFYLPAKFKTFQTTRASPVDSLFVKFFITLTLKNQALTSSSAREPPTASFATVVFRTEVNVIFRVFVPL